MTTGSCVRGRLAVLCVAVTAAGLLVSLPATAYASKATTRILAVSIVTVNRDTPGVNPWPKTLAVKLQKRVSGTHYHPLVGTVTLYRLNPLYGSSGSYRRVGSPTKGSSLTFSLPGRGRYKLYYAGTSTTKASTKYTGVYETVGLTLGDPDITFESVAGTTTQTWVNVKYNLSWNTEALDAVGMLYDGWFEDAVGDEYTEWVHYERERYTSGIVEYNYKVENADMMDYIDTRASAEVGWWNRGAYVKTPAEHSYRLTVP